MKRIFAMAVIAAIALTTLTACPTVPTESGSAVVAPQSATQTIYALELSLTVATNALADLHDAGVVVGDNYDMAVGIQRRAHKTLLDARAAVTAKNTTSAQVLLRTLSSMIDQMATYNGGKK